MKILLLILYFSMSFNAYSNEQCVSAESGVNNFKEPIVTLKNKCSKDVIVLYCGETAHYVGLPCGNYKSKYYGYNRDLKANEELTVVMSNNAKFGLEFTYCDGKTVPTDRDSWGFIQGPGDKVRCTHKKLKNDDKKNDGENIITATNIETKPSTESIVDGCSMFSTIVDGNTTGDIKSGLCSYKDGKSGYVSIANNTKNTLNVCWRVVFNNNKSSKGCYTKMEAGVETTPATFNCGYKNIGCKEIIITKADVVREKQEILHQPNPFSLTLTMTCKDARGRDTDCSD